MKKLILSIFAAAAVTQSSAQQQFVIMKSTNTQFGQTYNMSAIPVSDVDKIRYMTDPTYEQSLLDGQIASDPSLTLFYEALQLTGLADSLKAIYYPDYTFDSSAKKYYYKSHTWSEVAWYNQRRFKNFTVFAETDDVFAAAGITSLEGLKAYAKQVYDEYYPEDAAVSDPTDRRNSLNRFVAYHILPQGTGYYNLTCYDGYKIERCVDRNLVDIASWYSTLMPHAALKCSYPAAGTETGMYLNRRGLKGGPDKYGVQVRGAKIVVPEDGAFHEGFNGYYFHIDRILAYDKQTREEVLGGELWRVDFKHLSPDFMNNAVELLGNYMVDDSSSSPDDSDYPLNGRNMAYYWNSIENISGSGGNGVPLIHRRAHCNFWSWQGDEVNIFGNDYDFTIKLPQLPAGEWEVRMGYCSLESRPFVRMWLNDQQVVDSLDMRYDYYAYYENSSSAWQVKLLRGPKACRHFSDNVTYRFSENDRLVRAVLGRIKSDGKTDNYLRIKGLSDGRMHNINETMLDYFEFVPVSIADNTEIPEE